MSKKIDVAERGLLTASAKKIAPFLRVFIRIQIFGITIFERSIPPIGDDEVPVSSDSK